MLGNVKKLWPLAAASLVFFTSSAYCVANPSMNSNGSSRYGNKARTGAKGDVNPPARPYLSKGYGISLSGDVVYWKAVQDNLEFAATVNSGMPDCPEATNIFLNSYKVRYQKPDFNFSNGFRLGIGYTLPYDGWDLNVQWTRFNSRANGLKCASPCEVEQISSACSPEMTMAGACSSFSPCGDCNNCCDCQEPCCDCCEVCFDCGCPTSLIPLYAPILSQDQYRTTSSSAAHWSLHLNILDGEFGREFYVSRFLTFRPFFGVRGVWIHQKYQVSYESLVRVVDPEFEGYSLGSFNGCETDCTKFKNNFEGTGPRMGFNTNWLLGWGFSFYANAAISLLWGEFRVSSVSNQFICGELSRVNVETGRTSDCIVNECGQFQLKDSFQTDKAATDLALGLQYQRRIYKDQVGLTLQLGWDQHLFFSQNQISQVQQEYTPFPLFPVEAVDATGTAPLANLATSQLGITDRLGGDLSVQGLTFSARLDF